MFRKLQAGHVLVDVAEHQLDFGHQVAMGWKLLGALLVAGYLLSTELLKRWFFRRYAAD